MPRCKKLYPDGNDAETFYKIQEKLFSKSAAEELIILCNCDLEKAFECAKKAVLYHGNVFYLKKLCKENDNDIDKAMSFLEKRTEEK